MQKYMERAAAVGGRKKSIATSPPRVTASPSITTVSSIEVILHHFWDNVIFYELVWLLLVFLLSGTYMDIIVSVRKLDQYFVRPSWISQFTLNPYGIAG